MQPKSNTWVQEVFYSTPGSSVGSVQLSESHLLCYSYGTLVKSVLLSLSYLWCSKLSLPFQMNFGTLLVWYIDNFASLMALIKGRSDNLDLDHLAQMIHLLLYHLHCSLWFEWIRASLTGVTASPETVSKTDLSKTIYAFQCHTSSVPSPLWQLPIFLLSLVFSFL